MTKIYFILTFALVFCLGLPAQTIIDCGTAGTTITVTNLEFTTLRQSACIISYDITISTTEVGEYSIGVLGQTLIPFTITEPGTFQFQSDTVTVFPCILITDFLGQLDIFTPSGKCKLDLFKLVPVKLTHFTAEADNRTTLLKWGTATEVNNEGFVVEHTRNGEDWSPLGFVEGVGTTDEQQHYDFRIDGLPTGAHYFRLKQMDLDGRYEYSPVASLTLTGESDDSFKIFPNPLGRGQQLRIQGAFDQAEIFNAAGQSVLRFQSAEALNNSRFLDLPAGFYHLLVQRKEGTVQEKLVIH